MKYNFDEILDRRKTNCLKYDSCEEMFGSSELLPMWVADMDFRTPDFVLNAISERLKHPILGYPSLPKDYFQTIAAWVKRLHFWEVEESWLGFLPGIVPALSFAVQAFSQEGDEVIIQPPVYHPFIHVVKKNNRKLVFNPLKEKNGRFEMDFEDLIQKITSKTKLLILCNPHNPGGRAWDKASLKKLASICKQNNIVVVSDEIHSDMALRANSHTPFATVSKEAEEISLCFMSPAKTFNIPGLISAFYIVPNPALRKKFASLVVKNEALSGNVFAYAATMAAYKSGKEWREQMLDYVQGNVDFVVDFLEKHVPEIKPMLPEASFLIFLNCEKLGLDGLDLAKFFVKKAQLALNPGSLFGPGGERYMRMNLACPRSIVEEALGRIKKAVESTR